MAFKKKEWKDRLAEFAGRRRLVDVDTGEEQVVDVSRDEGLVSQEGDAFSATNMNDLESRIESAVNSASDSSASLENELNSLSQSTQKLSSTVSDLNSVSSASAKKISQLESQLGEWKIVVMPLSEYNSLSAKDSKTIYHCYD